MTNPVPEFELVEMEEGEIGEPVVIETPSGEKKATWLGTVSNGKELAEAMRLMWPRLPPSARVRWKRYSK